MTSEVYIYWRREAEIGTAVKALEPYNQLTHEIYRPLRSYKGVERYNSKKELLIGHLGTE